MSKEEIDERMISGWQPLRLGDGYVGVHKNILYSIIVENSRMNSFLKNLL